MIGHSARFAVLAGLFVICAVVGCIGKPLTAEDPPVDVTAANSQTNFFADDDVEYEVEFQSQQPERRLASWELTVLHRTLGRGDLQLNVEPDQPQSAILKLRMPHVKDDVIQQTTLTLSLNGDRDTDSTTIFQRNLWVFPRDPFVGRSEWLEQLDLRLYDPTGDTTKVLQQAKIPFTEIRSIAAMAAIEEGIVIIGEGIALRKNSPLAETLFSLAAAGGRVLWFAADQGDFKIPGLGDESEEKRPDNLRLMGSDRLKQLDKRLDPDAWDAEHRVDVQLTADRAGTLIQFVPATKGWTWLHAEFTDPKGEMILCGLRLAPVWDASPTPRFMLARLLEELDNTETTTESPDPQGT